MKIALYIYLVSVTLTVLSMIRFYITGKLTGQDYFYFCLFGLMPIVNIFVILMNIVEFFKNIAKRETHKTN